MHTFRLIITAWVTLFVSAALAQSPTLPQPGIAHTGIVSEPEQWWMAPKDATYVGSESCKSCHQKEYAEWKTSFHAQSMAMAAAETVLGDFENAELPHFGKVAKMTRDGGRFFIETDNARGEMQRFPVAYVFGVFPLQQYLVKFADGRVQCLPQAWDSREKKWFHLYPKDPLPPEDELHWRKPLQNWNYMCADCHSTDVKKNFDAKKNTYATTFSEIHVGCEACHGPASAHVDLANAALEAGKSDVARDEDGSSRITSLRLLTKNWVMTVETCAACHARRRSLYPGWRPGVKLMDHYVPELLDTPAYYPDGQILEEDFEYASFLQSNMYNKGIACADCHDVHTGGMREADNKVCARCHVPRFYDTPAHHHHPDASKPGTKCVECHLPPTTYMQNDIRYDHSIRRPRPDLSMVPEEGGKLKTPIPNACGGCHQDEAKGETAKWAHEKCREWYGPLTVNEPHFAVALEKGRLGCAPEATITDMTDGVKALIALLERKDLWPVVRASALLLLSRYHTPEARAAGRELLDDPDDYVRYAALRAVATEPNPAVLYGDVTPKLDDPVRAIRLEACAILAKLPVERFAEKLRKSFLTAEMEYFISLDYLADQPEAHLNRGIYWTDRGRAPQALNAYHAGRRLFPNFLPLRNNLGMLYNAMGRADLAEQEFREMQKLSPEMPEAAYSLGLMLAENPARLAEAAEFLEKAAAGMKTDPRVQYNCGLALMNLEKRDEAEKYLQSAATLAPTVPEYPHALAILYIQQEDWPAAVKTCEALVKRWPGNPQFTALLEHARRQNGK